MHHKYKTEFPSDAVADVLDYIIVSEIKLQSLCYVHFTLG